MTAPLGLSGIRGLLLAALAQLATDGPAAADQSPPPDAVDTATSDDAATPSWELVLRWLRGERDRMAADMETAHAALLARAEAEQPELAERLTPEPPRPRVGGWGVLPPVKPDGPPRTVAPRERRFRLETVSTNYVAAFRDAAVLAARSGSLPHPPLEPLVDEYERLEKHLRKLEQHIDYHAHWQAAVVEQAEYFAERNRLVGIARRLTSLREAVSADEAGDPSTDLSTLEAELFEGIAPFRAAAGLAVERRPDGRLVLPVRVHTDIADAAFLAELLGAVHTYWNASTAARERGFTVDLVLEHVSPSALYPEGPPDVGDPIDVDEHRGRFDAHAIVITTGATSTHAYQGRSLLLGPGAVTRSTLAHEFGHLLGFSDAYLRGYDGDPASRFGVELVEWEGLVTDLMGNPSGGVVTEAMLDTLVAAYGDG